MLKTALAMDHRFNKLIAIAIVIAIAICVYLVKDFHMITTKYERVLKVAVNLDNLAQPIDPMNNPTLSNAFFSNNLYSNLIEVDSNNIYRPDLASNLWFDTENKKIFFEFSNSRVTAKDAEFSLRRIILQNTQLHSDLWEVICGPDESRESCVSRIFVENEKLVIKYRSDLRSSYIVPTLASVDYKIVPIAAFDSVDPAKAKIIDYTKTSGHYYLSKEAGEFYFIKNQTSKLEIYNKFHIVNGRMALGASFKDVDIISTTVPLTKEVHEQIIKTGWSYFETYNISNVFIIFSQNGRKKTSAAQRFYISSLFDNELLKYRPFNSKRTIEIFQDFGQGYLSEEQRKVISEMRTELSSNTPAVITLGTKSPQLLAELAKKYPFIELRKLETLAVNLKIEDQPDFFTMSNDLSFDLNLSFISFAAKVGILKMNNKDISKFLSLSSDEEKVAFINKIHFETLKDCVIYPIWTVPYYTYFNGEFENNLSKFNSRTLLWKIH
jgi:hypothetical protein